MNTNNTAISLDPAINLDSLTAPLPKTHATDPLIARMTTPHQPAVPDVSHISVRLPSDLVERARAAVAARALAGHPVGWKTYIQEALEHIVEQDEAAYNNAQPFTRVPAGILPKGPVPRTAEPND
jgi:predicted DNA-binding protein